MQTKPRTSLWILDGKTPVPEPDVEKWSHWFGAADRKVASTSCAPLFVFAPVHVSTVFLGIDHNFFPDESAEPLLWETMVFDRKGHSLYDIQERCGGTRDDALAMHYRVAAQVLDRCLRRERRVLSACGGVLTGILLWLLWRASEG